MRFDIDSQRLDVQRESVRNKVLGKPGKVFTLVNGELPTKGD